MSEEFESEARESGWVPKEDFRGRQEDWVDAQTFVERGKQINGILKSNNERLKREMNKLQSELEEVKSSAVEFRKFQQEASETKIRNLEKELREVRAAKSEATAQENHEVAAELEEKIDDLKDTIQETKRSAKAEVKETKKADEGQIAPEVKSWMSNNTWFGNEDDYYEESQMAITIGNSIARKNPNVKGVAFLEMLDERLNELYPHLYSGKKGPQVTSGSNRTIKVSKTGREYSDLPKDAQNACDRFVKTIPGYTREMYLAEYSWEA